MLKTSSLVIFLLISPFASGCTLEVQVLYLINDINLLELVQVLVPRKAFRNTRHYTHVWNHDAGKYKQRIVSMFGEVRFWKPGERSASAMSEWRRCRLTPRLSSKQSRRAECWHHRTTSVLRKRSLLNLRRGLHVEARWGDDHRRSHGSERGEATEFDPVKPRGVYRGALLISQIWSKARFCPFISHPRFLLHHF